MFWLKSVALILLITNLVKSCCDCCGCGCCGGGYGCSNLIGSLGGLCPPGLIGANSLSLIMFFNLNIFFNI